MADLIDRQAAIDEIDSYEVNAPDYMQAWAAKLIEAIKGDIRGLISELPSAQPEIIRCKDCRHNGSFDTDCPIDWKGKEYCSFAER